MMSTKRTRDETMATLRQEFENEAKRLRKVKSEARDAPEEASLDHAKIVSQQCQLTDRA